MPLDTKKSLLSGNKSQVGKKQSKSFLQPHSFGSTGISGTLVSTYAQIQGFEAPINIPYTAGEEIPPSPPPVLVFKLLFNDIANANALVGDASNVADWNTFFDLPNYGNPFTSVSIVGNEINLIGGSNITIRGNLFASNNNIISVVDTGCILSTIDQPFIYCTSLVSVNLPLVTTVCSNCFYGCTSLTTISLPSCTNLGTTIGYDSVFYNIIGNTITLTIPSALMTCNGGNPDVDIIDLGIDNNLIINGDTYIPFAGYTGNLTLEWDNISNADLLVGDSSNVGDWNTFFNLSHWSTEFISVEVFGNSVTLIGGENIIIRSNLFQDNNNIISVVDTGCISYIRNESFRNCTSLVSVDIPSVTTVGFNCFVSCTSLVSVNLPLVTTVGESCFSDCNSLTTIDLHSLIIASNFCFNHCLLTTINLPILKTAGLDSFAYCTSLVSVDLPLVTTVGDFCFNSCTSLTTISLPSCINLGTTVDYNFVFRNISGKSITLTVPSALMTCDSGNPDGDIVYLQNHNTVTVITV
jgi:hypothetical protein